ncbi:MarR family transcriptional regulator [Arthrobacter sp. MYb229]|uniref:MarR family winged helix-turn-helix transcriptional regulator n=1 Tax=Micrococcaceae TaxID=1268 RepID=UPI000BB8AA06|nr:MULTISPECIES: MarR family transcriptional regulator [Micrococcaceae]PCC29347.1 hypothetical protein CIK76_08045 [Glutamicibacter sp. BW80]PRA06451.1 MarR family transcriptional regulator [Arthrobacter sp. MYb229]PRB53353.1 MarR family transcriptional regulator [Arthrobacter sp. MYb216]
MTSEEDPLAGLAGGLTLFSGAMSRLLGQAAGDGRSVTAWRVLSVLHRQGPQRVGDLAVQQRIAQPSMTGLVMRLEKDGLVQRAADPQDGRASLVSVTELGVEELTAYRQRAINALTGSIEAMTEPERETLNRALPLLERMVLELAENLDR